MAWKAKESQYAIEYLTPHWVIMIRNQGQSEWTALRDPERTIQIPNECGDIVQTRPAIQTFRTMLEAQQFAEPNLRGLKFMHRDASSMYKTQTKAVDEPAGVVKVAAADYGLRNSVRDVRAALS